MSHGDDPCDHMIVLGRNSVLGGGIRLSHRDDGAGRYVTAWVWDSHLMGCAKDERAALMSLAYTLRQAAAEVERLAEEETP
jgi:hypothetical protein